MTEQSRLNPESSAVQKHLEIFQGAITRMAENSRSCKVWCVTLVAATLVLVARTGEPQHALLALVPTLLFLVLDAYYLALELAFRNSYNGFVDGLHGGGLVFERHLSNCPARHGHRAGRTNAEVRLDMAVLPVVGSNGGPCLVIGYPFRGRC